MGADQAATDGGHDEDVVEVSQDIGVDFVSLGMFIIDDIEYLPPRPAVRDILGGAGAYAAMGARLFSPAPQLSRTVGWVVDQGSDFPAAMRAQIDGWQTAVVMREDRSRLTTRGWNGYDVGERRAFRYTTPKVRLTAEDLPPPLLSARSVHIVSSAERCRSLVTDLLERRRALSASSPSSPSTPRPYIVWEPVPDRCTPDELLDCTNTLPLVDVCSPNHAELAAYMGDPDGGIDPATGRPSAAAVERACEQLLSAMPLQSYAIVVRAAERGCYVAKNGGRRRPNRQKQYREEQEQEQEKKKSRQNQQKHKQNQLPSPPPPKRHAQLSLLSAPLRSADEPGHSNTPVPQTTASDHSPTAPLPLPPPPPSRPKQNLHGGLRPDIDMEALFAGLQQDEEGAIAREEIEVDPGLELWVPAVFGPGVLEYYDDKDGSDDKKENKETAETTETTKTAEKTPKSPVVDPTGGGNAFMGAMALALARGCSLEEAAVWGNVAASFAIQQVGVAVLGRDGEGRETWNGVRVDDRCAAYKERLRQQGLLKADPST